MFLTTLVTRARTPARILVDWGRYERQRQAAASEGGTRVVDHDRDVLAAQQRISAAVRAGEQPRPEDLEVRDPNWSAMVRQYAAEVIREHRYALERGYGDPAGHADAIVAWQVVGRVAGTAAGTREVLLRGVAIAERRSLAVVAAARAERKAARRAERRS